MPFVELGRNDLTAGDVNESAARKSQECNIDEGITLGDLHANDDSNGRGESKDSKEQKNLLQREASPCESPSKRYSCGRLVDQDSCSELAGRFNAGLQAEGDSFEKGMETNG